MLQVVFARKKAAKQFEKLDSHTKRNVANAIEEMRINPELGGILVGDLNGYYKYRVGDYRIVYSFDSEKVIVLTIAHRSAVYDEVKRYLAIMQEQPVTEPGHRDL